MAKYKLKIDLKLTSTTSTKPSEEAKAIGGVYVISKTLKAGETVELSVAMNKESRTLKYYYNEGGITWISSEMDMDKMLEIAKDIKKEHPAVTFYHNNTVAVWSGLVTVTGIVIWMRHKNII